MSNEYWADRVSRTQSAITAKTAKQIDKQMRKYYGITAKKMISEFESVYNKILQQQAEGKEVTPALLYRLDAYWQLQGQARRELQKLGEKQIALLTKNFELNFFEVYYSIAIPSMEAFSTLDTAIVQQMINHIWVLDGKSFSQRIWENTELLAETLNNELITCVASGKKTTDLKNMLQERFNVSYGRAEALVRTELAHVQTQAAQKRYEDYGIQEVQIWADEDERRCPICKELHQKRVPISSKMPIPAHTRCRCCVIPIVE